jgi:hypothetical protein
VKKVVGVESDRRFFYETDTWNEVAKCTFGTRSPVIQVAPILLQHSIK